MERSSSSHSSRSSCTGGKPGGIKPKENLGPLAASCTEGDTGALATSRVPRNDLGSSETDGYKVSISWAALKVGSPVIGSRVQLQLNDRNLDQRETLTAQKRYFELFCPCKKYTFKLVGT